MDIMEQKRRYAEVLVIIGLGLKENQSVVIEAPVEQYEFAGLVAEQAYKAGADSVHVLWKYGVLDRIRLEHDSSQTRNFNQEFAEYHAERGAGYIRLDTPDTRLFSGIDAARLNKKALEDSIVRQVFRKSPRHGGYTIACIPCQSWADMVFPDIDEAKRVDALWDAVLTCVRCKEEDPVTSWRNYIADTAKRKEKLNQKQYKAFHYKSQKTDLLISPVDNNKWQGGCIEYEDSNRVFIPNIPTEEVFTIPHRYKVNGYVASTLPLNYRGQLIEEFVLHFKDGRITDFSAQKGEDLLKAIIETDEGSHYIGEMALVDQKSPIAGLNRVFYTTLYDENASCHIAIGSSNSGPFKTTAENRESGYNDSVLHVDFMVGSDNMDIMGQLSDGTWENIMTNGRWSI